MEYSLLQNVFSRAKEKVKTFDNECLHLRREGMNRALLFNMMTWMYSYENIEKITIEDISKHMTLNAQYPD